MASVDHRGGSAVHREGPARSARDVVLLVGLAGAVVGGVVVMLRAAHATGSQLPTVLVVLVLLLGVGVALNRWGRAASGRRTWVRGADAETYAEAYAGTASADTDCPTLEVGQLERAVLDDVTVPLETAPTVAGPGAPPALDSEALDHLAVDPDGFEHTIAALCARDGCSPVEVVGGAGDLGADVIATTADGRRVVLQCKQYGEDHRVSSPDLQRFGGTCYAVHEADVAILVTTSTFTEPALEYAAHCGIVCVDGAELAAWTASTAPTPWDGHPQDELPVDG
ncbi:restriction endonuclease [Streptomyces sp. NPDC059695]|uniref:restriction endonuclease n=1 Tax=Streptomyces sp. NPDC059695 TaxID=3346910 RepID=UPI00369CD353